MYRQKYTSAAIIDEYGRVLISSEYAKIGISTPKIAISTETYLDSWESSSIAIHKKIKHQFCINNIKKLDFTNSISDTENRDTGIKKIDIFVFKIMESLKMNISNFTDNPVLFKSLSEIEKLQEKKIIELSWCAIKTFNFLKRDNVLR